MQVAGHEAFLLNRQPHQATVDNVGHAMMVDI
jgi:hypothetical protein